MPGHSGLVSEVADQYVGDVVEYVGGRVGRGLGRFVGFGVIGTRVLSQQIVSSAQFEVFGIITAGLSQSDCNPLKIQ